MIKDNLFKWYISSLHYISNKKVIEICNRSMHPETWVNIVNYLFAGFKYFGKNKTSQQFQLQPCDNKAPWYAMIFFHEGYAFAFWSSKIFFRKIDPTVFSYFGLGLWNGYVDRNILTRLLSVALPSKQDKHSFYKIAWYYDTYYWVQANKALKCKNNSSEALLKLIRNVQFDLAPDQQKFAWRGIGRALWLIETKNFSYIIALLNSVDKIAVPFLCIGIGNAMAYTRIQYPDELQENLRYFQAYSELVLEGVYIAMQIICMLSEDAVLKIADLYSNKFPGLMDELINSVAILKQDRLEFFVRSAYFNKSNNIGFVNT